MGELLGNLRELWGVPGTVREHEYWGLLGYLSPLNRPPQQTSLAYSLHQDRAQGSRPREPFARLRMPQKPIL